MSHHSISAGLDAAGNLTAWQHRIVCQSFIVGTPFEAFIVKDGVDETAVEGAKDLPYRIPNLLVDWQKAPVGVPTLWWRSVGHSHTAFVVESFLDEVAHGLGVAVEQAQPIHEQRVGDNADAIHLDEDGRVPKVTKTRSHRPSLMRE